MARPNILRAVVTADVRRFVAGMKKVEIASAKAAGKSKEEIDQIRDKFSKMGLAASMASVAVVAAFAAILRGIIKLNKESIEAAKTYETLALAFKLTHENTKIANREFAKLIDFADRTPFRTEDLVKYSIQLRNVTSGLYGTTEQIEGMAGALAKAQMLGKDQTFINSLGRIISAFQTGSGRIKLYTQTLLNTGAISKDTAIRIKELSVQGASAQEVIKVLGVEFRKSNLAAYQFSQTLQGIQSTVDSRKQLTLASVAGEEGLNNYKLIMKEISELLVDIRDTDAFKELGESFSRLNAEIFQMIKSDEFKQFLLDVMVITRRIVDAISAIVAGISFLNKSRRILEGVMTFGTSEVVRAGLGMDNIITGSEVSKMGNVREERQLKELQKLTKNTGNTAEVINPDKKAEF